MLPLPRAMLIVVPVPKLELSSLYTSISKHVIPAGIHVRLSCLTPFGLMQIRSRRICAGIQVTWTYIARHPWHWRVSSKCPTRSERCKLDLPGFKNLEGLPIDMFLAQRPVRDRRNGDSPQALVYNDESWRLGTRVKDYEY